MRLRAATLLCLLFAGAAAPQQPRPKLPPEIEHILGLARAVPPEFGASAMLDLVERGRIPDARLRRELIEDAFTLAGGAAARLRYAPLPAVVPESPEARTLEAQKRGLDALSLQTRAVRVLYAFDRAAARELFTRLPRLAVPELSCEAPFVYDVTTYYETIGLVFADAPDAIAAALERIESPVEITPAVDLLAALDLPVERWKKLADLLVASVDRMGGGDLAFTASFIRAARSLETLAIHAYRRNLPAAPALAVLGSYLKRHLGAPRCPRTYGSSAAYEASFVWYYNDKLRKAGYLAAEELPPLRDEEWRAAPPANPPPPISQSEEPDESKQLRAKLAGDGWSAFLRAYGDWKSAEDFFFWRCRLLETALDTLAPGPERQEAVRVYAGLLAESKAQRETPAEWLVALSHALRREEMRAALEGAPDATVDLYRRLARLR